jgi:hypothetical protein
MRKDFDLPSSGQVYPVQTAKKAANTRRIQKRHSEIQQLAHETDPRNRPSMPDRSEPTVNALGTLFDTPDWSGKKRKDLSPEARQALKRKSAGILAERYRRANLRRHGGLSRFRRVASQAYPFPSTRHVQKAVHIASARVDPSKFFSYLQLTAFRRRQFRGVYFN